MQVKRNGYRQLVAEREGWAVRPQSCRWHQRLKLASQLTAVTKNSCCRPEAVIPSMPIQRRPGGTQKSLDFASYFDNTRIMETLNAAELLAALGHESRLAIFRLLVEAGPEGINASAIGEQLGVAPATLSFHLAHLSRVGLIAGERESRFIHYSANYAAMDDLIAFLTSNCCQGQPCLPKTACCDTTEKRRATARKPS